MNNFGGFAYIVSYPLEDGRIKYVLFQEKQRSKKYFAKVRQSKAKVYYKLQTSGEIIRFSVSASRNSKVRAESNVREAKLAPKGGFKDIAVD